MEIAPPFDGRGFVYRRDEVRYETDFYNGFAADPAAMLAGAVAGWLAQGRGFAAVEAAGPGQSGDYRLDANVAAMYIDFRSNSPQAVLTVRWRLLRLGQAGEAGTRVVSLDCDERAVLPERSPRGAALAYGEALRQALAKLDAAIGGAGL